jgi:hypothetical protein
MQETIEIVRKGFPELNAYRPEDISFQSASGGVVLDEEWFHLSQDPPTILRIVISDVQGNWEDRQCPIPPNIWRLLMHVGRRRDNRITFSVIGGAMVVLMALFFLLNGMDESGKRSK